MDTMDASLTVETLERALQNNFEYPKSIFEKTNNTVTSLYASNPLISRAPQQAADSPLGKPKHYFKSKDQRELSEHEVTNEEMDLAAKYGRFPQRPSDLFLKV